MEPKMDNFYILTTWSPYLLSGIALNLLIAILATIIGSLTGAVLIWFSYSRIKIIRWFGTIVPNVIGAVPSLFLLFYLAILLPNEIIINSGEIVISLPNWLKAAIALAASPLAFTSRSLRESIKHLNAGNRNEALLFIPNLTNGFIITLLASSGSSLVGVNEIVSRTNNLIKTIGTEYAILLYSYAGLIFVISAFLISFIVRHLRKSINPAVAL